ncbi:DUF983 domain-containing protein [Kiloniella antarctica]|uniref:DUF983 domain-containing protein n=1 Tax=Kiloniella antarctica TaxID=1550907 RepID=A0ABW5BHJ3_9PROT
MSDDEIVFKTSPVKAGLLCKCPRCGKGRIYKGLLKLVGECSVCGFNLAKSDSGDGPAVFIVFILGFIIVPMAIWVELSLEPPIIVHLLICPIIVVGGSIALLRPLKGLMVALQYHHKASDSGSVDYD